LRADEFAHDPPLVAAGVLGQQHGDCTRAAASRTFCTAGSKSPISTAMMAITTSNSISVKAFGLDESCLGMMLPPSLWR
jgi:hypothetical protein